MKCKYCAHLKNEWCEKVIDSPYPDIERDCYHFRAMTIADHIRSMSDEELAVFLATSNICASVDTLMCEDMPNCETCVSERLKQPYKEEV